MLKKFIGTFGLFCSNILLACYNLDGWTEPCLFAQGAHEAKTKPAVSSQAG